MCQMDMDNNKNLKKSTFRNIRTFWPCSLTFPHSALPGGAVLNNVVKDQMKAVIFTNKFHHKLR